MINTALTLLANVNAGSSCDFSKTSSFLGFPTWYEYLPGMQVLSNASDPNSAVVCTPQLTSLNDVWLIAAAVIEILLRVAAIVAVGFVIYGGVQYITSQGEPDKTSRALQTIISAFVGLAISVLAAVTIGFIARSIK